MHYDRLSQESNIKEQYKIENINELLVEHLNIDFDYIEFQPK